MEIRNAQQSNWHTSTDLGSLRGGDSATLFIRERNHANNPIETNIEIIINEAGEDNVCEEIESMIYTDHNDWSADLMTYGPGCVEEWIDEDDSYGLVLRPFDGQLVPVGGPFDSTIVVTFAQNAVGSYEATVRHMNP